MIRTLRIQMERGGQAVEVELCDGGSYLRVHLPALARTIGTQYKPDGWASLQDVAFTTESVLGCAGLTCSSKQSGS